MPYIGPGNLLYAFDSTRGKNLSLQRVNFPLNHDTSSGNLVWLQLAKNVSTIGETGYPMLRDATITNITAMCRQINTGDIELQVTKNDDEAGTDLIRLQFPQTGADASPVVISGSLNIDLNQADFLQGIVKDNGSGGIINNPIMVIEVAWRDS